MCCLVLNCFCVSVHVSGCGAAASARSKKRVHPPPAPCCPGIKYHIALCEVSQMRRYRHTTCTVHGIRHHSCPAPSRLLFFSPVNKKDAGAVSENRQSPRSGAAVPATRRPPPGMTSGPTRSPSCRSSRAAPGTACWTPGWTSTTPSRCACWASPSPRCACLSSPASPPPGGSVSGRPYRDHPGSSLWWAIEGSFPPCHQGGTVIHNSNNLNNSNH